MVQFIKSSLEQQKQVLCWLHVQEGKPEKIQYIILRKTGTSFGKQNYLVHLPAEQLRKTCYDWSISW